MVVAQEKYLYPEPAGRTEETVSRRPKARVRRQHRLSSRAKVALGGFTLGALFLLGVAIAISYIYPTQLGYRQISLEKELAAMEKENKQIELAIAKSRSLDRVEYIAINKLSMERPEEAGVMVAIQPQQPTDSEAADAASSPTIQNAARMVASAQTTASRGTRNNAPADD